MSIERNPREVIAPIGDAMPALPQERKRTVEEFSGEIGLAEMNNTLLEAEINLLDAVEAIKPILARVDRALSEKIADEVWKEIGLAEIYSTLLDAETTLLNALEAILSIRARVDRALSRNMVEESSRVRLGLEMRGSDAVGRSKKRVSTESATRSSKLKQSMAVAARLEEENEQQLKERDNLSARQIVANTSSRGIGSSFFVDRIGSSQNNGVKQPRSSYKQSVESEENGGAKQSVGAASSSRIGFSQNIVAQPVSSSQQLMKEEDDTNIADVVCIEPDCTNVTNKQSMVWTLDREYRINRDVLEQHFGKKLAEVADILGVSRSTLKRICRRYDIFRWPPHKGPKGSKHSLTHQEAVQTTRGNVEESTQGNQPLDVPPLEKFLVSNRQTTSNLTQVLDDRSIMVKATYKDVMIKFPLSVSSRKLDLEEEVAMRLTLPVGSFTVAYLDEDEDWVLITCDSDLSFCIRSLAPAGKATIKLRVVQM